MFETGLAITVLPLASVWAVLLPILSSVVGFALVVVAVVGLFGHAERAEVSPQRQIAIAMGQGDRHTLYESDVLGPLMWVFLKLAQTLNLPWLKQWLRGTLVAAGSPKFYTAEEYLAIAMAWSVVTGVALGLLNLWAYGSFSLVAFGFGLVGGLVLPVYYMRDVARRRMRTIGRRLPYSLDLVALAMGAGSTFVEAVRTVVREDPHDPLNQELNTVLSEMDLGNTRKAALANLAQRVQLQSLRSIVASIIQAEELGTPVGEVLKGQSALLRLHRSVRAEKLAALASVRILLPSILILLSVVLTVFAPLIIRAIRKDLF